MTTATLPLASSAPTADTPAKRFHFGLTVSNLDRSVEFYRILLGAEPRKHFADYAKFDVADPPVVLALHPGKFATSGALNHVGFRLADSAALVRVQERLELSGIRTQREEGVECCYALQTKFWVPDPDGNLWEVYTLHEDLDHSGFGGDGQGMPPKPAVTTSVTWDHMLIHPIPARIPHEDGTVDEVRLEGTFNMEVPAETRQALLTEAFRALRPGGRVWIHGLVADQPFPGRPNLPGPAAMVQWIPVETLPAEELRQAGFVGLNYDKLGDIHCFKVNGIELRQMQLAGIKPQVPADTWDHYVLYLGPLESVVDDRGTTYERGKRTKVDAATWTQFRQAPYEDHFTCFRCATPSPVSSS